MNVVESQEVVAFHEAGHAVAHHHFGLPVDSIEIREGAGCCVPPSEWRVPLSDDWNLELAKREALLQLTVACCSGKCSMDKLYGRKASTDTNWKQSDDYRNALDYALKLADGDEVEAELWLQIAEHKADKLIAEQWGSIHKLAFALLDREKLSGAQIDAILIKPNKQLR
jgi:ATP-dependent Zn protease